MLGRTAFAFLASLLLTTPGAAQDCPIKDLNYEARETLLRNEPSCDKAREWFGICSYGASGDVPLGQIVIEKCEGSFLAKLSKVQQRGYDREIKACDDDYKNKDGSMYRAMAAGCRVDIAQSYARKFREAPPRK
jgi:hypothetical protein